MERKQMNILKKLKNKATLVALISVLALMSNQICVIFGVDYSAQIEQLVNLSSTILLLLSGLGIIVDPTTPGVTDGDKDNVVEADKEDNPKEGI